MNKKLTPQELIYLDEAISEMNYHEKIKELQQQEEWMENLIRKRQDIDNEILHYQLKHMMSWPFDIREILKFKK